MKLQFSKVGDLLIGGIKNKEQALKLIAGDARYIYIFFGLAAATSTSLFLFAETEAEALEFLVVAIVSLLVLVMTIIVQRFMSRIVATALFLIVSMNLIDAIIEARSLRVLMGLCFLWWALDVTRGTFAWHRLKVKSTEENTNF